MSCIYLRIDTEEQETIVLVVHETQEWHPPFALTLSYSRACVNEDTRNITFMKEVITKRHECFKRSPSAVMKYFGILRLKKCPLQTGNEQ